MKKILSNKKLDLFAGLVVGLCLLGVSDMAFATDGGGSGACELPTLVDPAPTVSGRSFQLHVPPGSPANAPLIIDVHAYMGDWNNQACNTRYWDKTGDQAYIVYPEGTGAWYLSFNGGDGGPGYNGCCGTAMDTDENGNLVPGVNDVQYIREIVLYMVDNYNIDTTRIYGSGLSNGSAMIQRMIVEEPDLFAAVFVSSQHLLELPHPNQAALPQLSVPIMLSYGTLDNTYKGQIGNQKDKFPRGEETFKRWAMLNGCIKDESVDPYDPSDSTYLPGDLDQTETVYESPYEKTAKGSKGIKYSCLNDGSLINDDENSDAIEVVMWLVIAGHSHYDTSRRYWWDGEVDIAQKGWDFMKKYQRTAQALFITQHQQQ